MKHIRRVAVLALFLTVLSPSLAQAQGLTQPQISAIVGLLEAFNVDSATLVRVVEALEPPAAAPVVKQAVTTDAPDESMYQECLTDTKLGLVTPEERRFCTPRMGI